MTYHSFHFFVSGRVQGVSFRAFAKRAAQEGGIVGWVRNHPSGDVEGVAQGPADALAKFKKALEVGPKQAHVTNVHITDEKKVDQPEYRGFEVR
ncbi:Acylphosphatase [Obba rivulosa]|uniref:Acylphosphatase n=1 Tax=Obba rivulosa TaxID=1052685 RepID=A0A8E2DPQ9_9APHY|nr:Acylphosphatase [Obba rivulosa]